MLREFQRDFAAAIAVPQGAMRVYRNTVISGCVDALRDNYPIIAQLLGEEMFDAIAAEHAAALPPRRPVLALYGEHFSDWLEVQPWITDVPYLPDVARVERLRIESLFAADAPTLEQGQLRGDEDWNALHLLLHPATRFDWLTSPAMSIWLSQLEHGQDEFEFDWVSQGVLMTRPALQIRARVLDRAEHRFLFGIRLGESVGAAALAAAGADPDADIGSLFISLVNAGAFAASPNRSLP